MGQSNELDDLKKYYEARYRDESRSSRKLKDYEIFIKYLKGKNPGERRYLDIACGKGYALRNAELHHMKSFGLDIAANALQEAKKNTTQSHVVLSSSEEICFKNRSFDFISCLGSLEHFIKMTRALDEMKRVAKPDARFCILVPNNIHYRLDSKSKWGIKKIVGTKQQEMREELHSYREWRDILQRNGFRIEKVYKDLFFIRKKNPLKNLLFFVWLKFLPLKYSYQFIFLCTLKDS